MREPVGGFSSAKKQNEIAEKQRKKALTEQEKLRRSWPRLEFPSECAGESIYINRRIYEGITKKARIINFRVIGGSGGKLVIEYQSNIWGGGRGTLELLDIGRPY